MNTLTGIVFTWNRTEKIYTHAESATNRPLQKHSPMPQPLDGFMETIYADTYNVSPDFRDYFVFPKLSADYQEDADSYQEIKTADDLFPLLTEKAQILISGATSSGKTTLLKYLYAQLTPSKCPLFLPIDTHTKLKASNFVKRLFLDQYGVIQSYTRDFSSSTNPIRFYLSTGGICSIRAKIFLPSSKKWSEILAVLFFPLG